MAKALLIDQIFLVENSPLSANVDMEMVFPFVRTAQELTIQEAIGTSLLNYLLDLVATGGPYSPEDEIVLDLCRNALVWYATLDAVPFIWVQLRNIGVVKRSGDNMAAVDSDEMNILKNEIKTKGAWYINRLISYLCANGSKYAAYNEGCYSCGDVSPASKPSNSVDLYFPDGGYMDESRAEFILRNAGYIK